MIIPVSSNYEPLRMIVEYRNNQRLNLVFMNWDELFNMLVMMGVNYREIYTQLRVHGFTDDYMILSQDMLYNKGCWIKSITVKPHKIGKLYEDEELCV